MDRRRLIISTRLLLLIAMLVSTAVPPSLAQAQQRNATTSQRPSRSRPATGGFTPTTVIVLVVLVGAFFVLTFFSIYINRCAPPPPPRRRESTSSYDHHHHQDGDGAVSADHQRRDARGLDRDLVESFPTAVYADVKARRVASSGPLECAVCLAEFEDSDELRVLPACCHVFHPDCIDPWLAAAVTCPLCRADLQADLAAPPAPLATEGCDLTPRREQAVPEEEEPEDEACLVVAGAFTPESLVSFGAARPHEFHCRRTQSAMDAPDRHTLRLPDHVMRELAAVRTHRRAASLAGYPDAADRTTTNPSWFITSFWRNVSWRRQQSRADAASGGEEHGGSKRVVPIVEAPLQAEEERPSGSGSGGNEKGKSDEDDAFNRV